MKYISFKYIFILALFSFAGASQSLGMEPEAALSRPACATFKAQAFQHPSLMGITDDLKRTVIKEISHFDNGFAVALTLANLKQVNRKYRRLVSSSPFSFENYSKPIKAYKSLLLNTNEQVFFLIPMPKIVTHADPHRSFLDLYLEYCQSKMNYVLPELEYHKLRTDSQRIIHYLGFQKEIKFSYNACKKNLDTVYVALTK